MDLLFVGLGNPGEKYKNTRHNAGFMLIDKLAEKYTLSNQFSNKFSSLTQKITIDDRNILLIKPQTFMNLSGKAVLQAQSFYKLSPSQIWVFHDDIDLDTARIKIKKGGGSGGHNGIKSIDSMIGPEYFRVRIGIKHDIILNTADFVLKNFSQLEMDKMTKIIDNMVENISLLISGQNDKFLCKIIL